MQRKSIKHIYELPLTRIYSILKNISYYSLELSGKVKDDGIFISFGLDEDDEFFFQTSKSPRCYNMFEYRNWVKSYYKTEITDYLFVETLNNLISKLINCENFQRFLHIQKAMIFPKKEYECSAEWLSRDLAEEHISIDNVRYLKYIKTLYPYYDKDIIIFHDIQVQDFFIKKELWNLGLVIGVEFRGYSIQRIYFDSDKLIKIMNIINEDVEIITSKKSKYNERKKELRLLIKEFFSIFYFENKELDSYIEGIVNLDYKVIKHDFYEKELNRKLFYNER